MFEGSLECRKGGEGPGIMRHLVVSVALLTLAACAGSSDGVSSSQIPTRSIASLLPPTQAVKPDACDKPKVVLIKKTGGTFTIPTCAGWSGTFGYPPQFDPHNPAFHFQLTSSVKNNFGSPPPPYGTPIFYLQMGYERSPVAPDFQNTGVTDLIASSQLSPSGAYWLDVTGGIGYPFWNSIGSPSPSSDSITFLSPLNGNNFEGLIVWQFVLN